MQTVAGCWICCIDFIDVLSWLKVGLLNIYEYMM